MAQVKDLLVKGQAKFLRKAYFQDQIVSNVAQGTAPLVVASSTVVSNLNSDYLNGYHASGLFTALSANSTLSITIGGTTLTSSINAATVDGKYISNYYTKSEADDRFVNVAGDTMSGTLYINKTGSAINSPLLIGNNSTKANINTSVADQTTMMQIVAGDGGSTNSSAVGFHNPGISSAVLEYRNTDANTGSFNFRSDNTTWRIGVGTTSPIAKVHIVTSSSNSNSNFGLYIQENANRWAARSLEILAPNLTSGSSPFITIGKIDSAYNMGWIGYVHSSDNSSSNRLSFGLHSVDNILNIVGTNKVGIGTTSPVGKLDIKHTTSDASPGLAINYYEDYQEEDLSLAQIKFGKPSMNNHLGCTTATKSHFGKKAYAFHTENSYEFAWLTSGWTNIMSLEASSGNLWIKGRILSDYITVTPVKNASDAYNIANSSGTITSKRGYTAGGGYTYWSAEQNGYEIRIYDNGGLYFSKFKGSTFNYNILHSGNSYVSSGYGYINSTKITKTDWAERTSQTVSFTGYAGGSYIGWISVAKLDLNTYNQFDCKSFIFNLTRNYNSPSSESYSVAITVGWVKTTIRLISKSVGGQIINKIRLALDSTNHKLYLQYYVNTSHTTYRNDTYMSMIGNFEAFTPITAVVDNSPSTVSNECDLSLWDEQFGLIKGSTGNGLEFQSTSTGSWKEGVRIYPASDNYTLLSLQDTTSSNVFAMVFNTSSKSAYFDYYKNGSGKQIYMPYKSGTIALTSDISDYTYSKTEEDNRFVNVTGDTMTGNLKINATPSQSDPPLQVCYTSSYTATEQSIGLIKFGSPTYDAYLGIAPASKTVFGKVGYFYHIGSSYEYDWMSSGWSKLMALECSTGDLWVKSRIGINDSPRYPLTATGVGDIIQINSTSGSYTCINYTLAGYTSWSAGITNENKFYFWNINQNRHVVDINQTGRVDIITSETANNSLKLWSNGPESSICFADRSGSYTTWTVGRGTGSIGNTYGWWNGSRNVMTLTNSGQLSLIESEHSLKIYNGYNYHPCSNDSAGRPGISISGNYPYIWLTGGGVSNSQHGATITLCSPDSVAGTNGAFKTWTFGVPGQNATWLDLAYSYNYGNPHNGINGWAGLGSPHRIMRWNVASQNQVIIYGSGANRAASLVVNSSTASTWVYGASFLDSNLGTGHNIWINVGKSNSTRNSFGLSWHHDGGDGSTSNYGAIEIWGVGNVQRWYTNGDTTFPIGSVTATAFYESSDERLKDFENDISIDFESLKTIPKKYFRWKKKSNNLHIGTSAQAIRELYPELVSESEDGMLSVDYAKLSIVALKAIDVLYDEIKLLKLTNSRLEKRIQELEK